MKLISVLLFFFLVSNSSFAQDELRLNQIQIIASHNSYKKRLSENEMKFMEKMTKRLGNDNNPMFIDY
jgi:hypothetical protein